MQQPDAVALPDPGLSEEDAPATGAVPRRRGSRGSGRTRRAAAAAANGTAVAPAAPLQPQAIAEPDPELSDSEPLLLPNQNQIPGAARRARSRGRGGAGLTPRGDARPMGTLPRTESPRPAPMPQQSSSRGGSVESLFARQNVLFEQFANEQAQAMREMQRTLGNAGRGGAVQAGSSLALPKVAIFLDVPNLIYAAEQMGARVHFGKLLALLTDGRQLVRATAYAPITDDPMTRFEMQRFVAPVLNNGYKIVTKPWKRFADGSMKANFDIELAVDILTMSDRLDIVVLLSGDGDFRRVCELVESKGVRVEVVAFAASTSMELRSVADLYTDLGQIMHLVGV